MSAATPYKGIRKYLAQIPLKRQIMLMMTAGTLLSIGLLSIVFLGIARYSLQQQLIQDSHSQANILAGNLQAAVTFQYESDAEEILSSLKHRQGIICAEIYLPDQTLLADYRTEQPKPSTLPKLEYDTPVFKDSYLITLTPIQIKGTTIGELLLIEDMRSLNEIFRLITLLIILIAAAMLGTSYAIAKLARGLIAEPIEQLASTARAITQERDFTQRASQTASAEVYELTRAFNTMLDEIALHEADLQKQKHELTLSRDAAQAANRSKSEFLAMMNHELRTPLNPIIGLSELMIATQDNPELLRNIKMIHNSANQLLELINSILHLSLLESGHHELNYDTVSLYEIKQRIEALFSFKAENKTIEFKVKLDSAPNEKYFSDPQLLQSAITNVVGNAIKFTKTGHVHTRLAITQKDNTPVLIATVEDTGPGIAPKDKERIFDAFTQVDSSYTREFGGVGLGLAITRQALAILNGSIDLESIPGKGTTFKLQIPLSKTPGI